MTNACESWSSVGQTCAPCASYENMGVLSASVISLDMCWCKSEYLMHSLDPSDLAPFLT